MRELPILMNGAMVRAVLEGRKTVTRRLVKPQPRDGTTHYAPDWLKNLVHGHFMPMKGPYVNGGGSGVTWVEGSALCPYGKVGQRLYVRERFKPIAFGQFKRGSGGIRYGYAYEADGHALWNDRTTIIHDLTGQAEKGPTQFQPQPWRAAVTMPHRACRLWLEVTGARVERPEDITDAYVTPGQDGPSRDVVLTVDQPIALWNAAELPYERIYLARAYGMASLPETILGLHRSFVDFDRRLIDSNPPGRRQTRKHRPVVQAFSHGSFRHRRARWWHGGRCARG